MAGEGVVTILAGIVDAAALHPDSEDVELGSIVRAARLLIEIDSANLGA